MFQTTASMFQGSFGILYSDFMEELGINSVHIMMMMGFGSICAATAGKIKPYGFENIF